MKTNYLIFLLTILFFTSCSSGKYYANYRVGGKSKKEEKTLTEENQFVLVDNKSLPDKKEYILNEIVCVDTFSLQPIEKNSPAYQIKYSTIKTHEIIATVKKINPIKNSPLSKTTLNKKWSKKKNYSKKGSRFFKFLLIAGILFGAFLLAQALGITTAFWITVGIILSIIIGFFIAIFIVAGLIYLIIEELFSTIYLRHRPKKSPFKSVNHGERIATLFWTLIGVVILGGIISAIVFIPNFLSIALIVLAALLTAALIGAVFAAFIDLIMPGDSMF